MYYISGSYAYFNQGPISIQNTQLGGNKQYHSPGHIDFSNHFAFSNANNELILPQSHFSFNKHPSQNELQPNHFYFVNQNDEFTRNLVPPPPIYKPQGEKEIKPKEPSKIIEQSATVNTPQLVIGNHKDEMRHVPENFIGQLPPPYNKFSQQQNIGQPGYDLEITKEKFKEYHTTLAPSSFKTSTESFLDTSRFTKPKKDFTKSSLAALQHVYEVTEEKEWHDHSIPPFKPVQQTYSTLNPHSNGGFQNKYIPNKYHYSQQIVLQDQDDEEPSGPQFLPTPYSPESVFPTSPTQAEVSTIYSEISQLNKMKNPFKVPEPTSYNIKDVATHFPIFETRKPEIITTPENHQHHQFIQEVTTKQQFQETQQETDSTRPYIKPTQQTTIQSKPTFATSPKRPGHRRRRPTKPTTDAGEFITDVVVEQENTTEKPHRRRRPIKYRTTESSDQMSNLEASTRPSTITYRPRPTRPQLQVVTEEQFVNRERYRPNYKLPPQVQVDEEEETNPPKQYSKFNRQREDNKYRKEENYNNENEEEIVTHFRGNNQQGFNESPTTAIVRTSYNKYTEEAPIEDDQATIKLKKRKRLRPLPPTTELSPSTNLNIPENDIEYTTLATNEDQSEESVTIKEIYNYENEKETTTLLTTPPATTSTSSESTTKSNRIRRPIKYDVQRPRFSVKDYRQRLNQYMSTTADPTKFTSEGTSSSPRIRYPNRFKIPTTAPAETEDATENNRQKFIPKDPRHRQQYQAQSPPQQHLTETTETSDKYSRTASPRIRPFGRYRSTTETAPLTSSTTQKVSIKPNIFTNLKRPQHLSLRNRIYNKRNSTTTTELITDIPDVEDSASHTERTEVTIPFESAESKIEVTTQIYQFKKTNHDDDENDSEDTTNAPLLPTIRTKIKHTDVHEEPEVVTPDETEAFLQLQRISDLTSSAHKQYNTPGLFKSVSPTSRRVPNYFTIATEDPILPIEAFFPNLNKHSDKQN